MSGYDEDELQALGQTGILGGKALEQYESVRENITANGVEVGISCRWCGKPSIITLEWPELFFVGANGPQRRLIAPPNWHYSEYNQSLYVAIACPSCNNNSGQAAGLAVHVTPDEARKYFTTALTRGFVSPQQAAHLKEQVAAILGGG